ncbi:chemotaxis protein CheW [Caldibacillus lycopersici]|uniref:Chemotaxis protein CheW n=1 Tax=Perspicuibacillus lycopersici TaxID=1325689 RepID=A0AAE3IRW0_9BACI|nr:chemotaxis protein CheW [Perspicuibacillus lycopersici]MCU9612276.1 chemotaxis protein CheW [Perspicuibacillus lycopersici]
MEMMINTFGWQDDTEVEQQSFLQFYVGQQSFAIDLQEVIEISKPLPITRTQTVHPFIQGVTDIRGEVVPVIELAQAFSYPQEKPDERERFIITSYEEQKVAFRVQEVAQIIFVNKAKITTEVREEHLTPYVGGSFTHGEVELFIVQKEKLWDAIEH